MVFVAPAQLGSFTETMDRVDCAALRSAADLRRVGANANGSVEMSWHFIIPVAITADV